MEYGIPPAMKQENFSNSAQDTANFGKLNYDFDKRLFTSIRTSISNQYTPMLYKGEIDLMQGVSVLSSLFDKLSKPASLITHHYLIILGQNKI
jgi:hypothetical protein